MKIFISSWDYVCIWTQCTSQGLREEGWVGKPLATKLKDLDINLWTTMNFYWRRQWHPTPVLLPGKSHGRRSLVGCSLWGRKESDMTEWLHFSLSCIGEGNGNPLQCSCLDNPRDGGAWWATIYGVAQSRTRLKRLSSRSSSSSTSIRSASQPRFLKLPFPHLRSRG